MNQTTVQMTLVTMDDQCSVELSSEQLDLGRGVRWRLTCQAYPRVQAVDLEQRRDLLGLVWNVVIADSETVCSETSVS